MSLAPNPALRSPVYCRPEAFTFLASLLTVIESNEGLLLGALAIAMHALDDFDPHAVLGRINELGDMAASRVRAPGVDARLAHIHQLLFDELGFAGNGRDYYSPLNSYLPAVLETRLGIPISLALVYKAVAERIGLEVQGVNAPYHFLVRVRDGERWQLLDPYSSGKLLAPGEAIDHIERVTAARVPRGGDLLRPATHLQWLRRMVGNLYAIFEARRHDHDRLAMAELNSLLGGAAAGSGQ